MAVMNRHRAFQFIQVVGAVALGLIIIPVLTPLVSAPPAMEWFLDLLTHFQWAYLALFAVAVAVGAFQDRRFALLAPLCALPWVTAASPASEIASGPGLRLAVANVNIHSDDPARLLTFARTERADLIIILEVSPDFAARLSKVAEFPHQQFTRGLGVFGAAVLSRYPIQPNLRPLPASGTGRVDVVVDGPFGPWEVSAFHPMPPLTVQSWQVRDTELRALAQVLGASGRPAVIAGDFNATPWSSAFHGVEAMGWRRATGLLPSWPSRFGGWTGIPIDHVLMSDDLGVAESRVGPAIGSDHFPVFARIGPA